MLKAPKRFHFKGLPDFCLFISLFCAFGHFYARPENELYFPELCVNIYLAHTSINQCPTSSKRIAFYSSTLKGLCALAFKISVGIRTVWGQWKFVNLIY